MDTTVACWACITHPPKTSKEPCAECGGTGRVEISKVPRYGVSSVKVDGYVHIGLRPRKHANGDNWMEPFILETGQPIGGVLSVDSSCSLEAVNQASISLYVDFRDG